MIMFGFIRRWQERREQRRKERLSLRIHEYLVSIDDNTNVGIVRQRVKGLASIQGWTRFEVNTGGFSKCCVCLTMEDGFEVRVYEFHEIDALRRAGHRVADRLSVVYQLRS